MALYIIDINDVSFYLTFAGLLFYEMTYKDYLLAQDLSAGTIQNYCYCVEYASQFADITQAIKEESISPSRRDQYRKALLHYAAWKNDKDLEKKVRGIKVKGRNRRIKEIEALETEKEWPMFLEKISKIEPPALSSVLYLIATSGLRLSEVLNLTKIDLQEVIAQGRTEIIQKGGKKRDFFVVTEEQDAEIAYLEEILPKKKLVWELLKSKRRKTKKGVEDFIRRELQKIADDLNINKKITPHTFRRTLADAVYDATGEMKLVQELLGHDSLQTTLNWYQDHKHPEKVAKGLYKALKPK